MTLPFRRPRPVGGNRPGPPFLASGSVGSAVGLRLDAGAGDSARSLVRAAAECVALPLPLALAWGAGVEAVGGLVLGTRLQADRSTARAGKVQTSRCIKSLWPYTPAARKRA